MIEIVFVACLTATPDVCRERSLTYAETMTPQACLMRAQPQLAVWAETHPKWRIARWKCQSAGRRGYRI